MRHGSSTTARCAGNGTVALLRPCPQGQPWWRPSRTERSVARRQDARLALAIHAAVWKAGGVAGGRRVGWTVHRRDRRTWAHAVRSHAKGLHACRTLWARDVLARGRTKRPLVAVVKALRIPIGSAVVLTFTGCTRRCMKPLTSLAFFPVRGCSHITEPSRVAGQAARSALA